MRYTNGYTTKNVGRYPLRWKLATIAWLNAERINPGKLAKALGVSRRLPYFWLEPWPSGLPRALPTDKALRQIEKLSRGRVQATLYYDEVAGNTSVEELRARLKTGTRRRLV